MKVWYFARVLGAMLRFLHFAKESLRWLPEWPSGTLLPFWVELSAQERGQNHPIVRLPFQRATIALAASHSHAPVLCRRYCFFECA